MQKRIDTKMHSYNALKRTFANYHPFAIYALQSICITRKFIKYTSMYTNQYTKRIAIEKATHERQSD